MPLRHSFEVVYITLKMYKKMYNKVVIVETAKIDAAFAMFGRVFAPLQELFSPASLPFFISLCISGFFYRHRGGTRNGKIYQAVANNQEKNRRIFHRVPRSVAHDCRIPDLKKVQQPRNQQQYQQKQQ